MLDKSEGLKATEKVSDTEFDNPSAWALESSLAISNGELVLSSSAVAGGAGAYTFAPTVVGKTYRISFEVTEITIANIQVAHCNSSGGSNQQAIVAGITTVGKHSFNMTATGAATTGVRIRFAKGNGATATIINFSMQEIAGSHATQPTSTKRPIYARHPEGGIRNLLNYSEQFDNNAWEKQASTILSNQITSPSGEQTASLYTNNNTNGHLAKTTTGLVDGAAYTVSVYVKKSNNRWFRFSSSSGIFSVWFDLDNGVVGVATGTSTNSIESVGNDWYRCSATFSVVATSHIFYMMNAAVNGSSAEIAGGAAYIWGAQVEEEATEASNYQKRVTDIDVTESGVGEVYYLKFDGVDDGMQINNLTSPNTPLTALLGYSATNATSTTKYLFDIQTGRTISGISDGYIRYFDGAWSQFSADSNAIKVLTYDLVENNAKIRIDGTQEYSDTTYDQRAIGGGIGLYQGHSGGGSYIAGNMYQTILRAAESTDEEIAKAETYVANKTGLKAQVDGIATLDLNFGNNTYTAKNSNGGVI